MNTYHLLFTIDGTFINADMRFHSGIVAALWLEEIGASYWEIGYPCGQLAA